MYVSDVWSEIINLKNRSILVVVSDVWNMDCDPHSHSHIYTCLFGK